MVSFNNLTKFILTTIEVFDDRIEISNPGGLLSAISLEFGKKSLSRNPLVFGLFDRMHLVEKIGSGIPRMEELMHDNGLTSPEYKLDWMFTILLKRPIKTVEKTVEEIIVDLIRENPKITTKDMTTATGLSRRGVEYQLNKLKESGKIERIGPDKGGVWKIT